MKLFSAKQIQEWDKYTIKHEPISSYDLMERAVKNLYVQLKMQYDFTDKTVQIWCGYGNNGGDGLALARYMKQDGIKIMVVYVGDVQKASPDNEKNFQLAKETGIPLSFYPNTEPLPVPDYIIDALLGTGLNRSITPDSDLGKAITYIINTNTHVISIDIPSGLMSEDNRENRGIWVKADVVYSFQQPKIVFFLKEWVKDFEQWHIVDIGLSQEYYESTETKFYALTEQVFHQCFKPRIKFSHKGIYGHALLVGGLEDKTGAGILAAKAAYRSGCGLLTAMSNQKHQTAFNIALPEAMFCSTKTFMKNKDKTKFLEKFDSIGIGHGLGTHEKSFDVLLSIIKNYPKRIVIDADGITLLSQNPDLWEYLQGKEVVLTPHIKEAERLLGVSFKDSLSRIEACQQLTKEKHCIIVLKDTITTVIFPDSRIYFSDNGCSGMAKGGTGDILTGILTSTMAQNYTINEAVLTAVYSHSLAAKKALSVYSDTSLIPSDIVSYLYRR
jgi:NAD(P)H-hydrate epimerase